MPSVFGAYPRGSRREFLVGGGALCAAWASGCREGREGRARFGGSLFVAVASSLRELFETGAGECEPTRLVCSFDASSTLARQIQAGAEYDAFVSADRRSLERVRDWGRGVPRPFLGNRLALVARAERAPGLAHPRDLLMGQGAIAVGAPEVPAGRYARAWLDANGLGALATRFVHGRNARAVLGLVEAGVAEFAFVYRSAAERARRGVLVWTAAPEELPAIHYWVQVARETHGEAGEAAALFVRRLTSGVLDPLARTLGFSPLV